MNTVATAAENFVPIISESGQGPPEVQALPPEIEIPQSEDVEAEFNPTKLFRALITKPPEPEPFLTQVLNHFAVKTFIPEAAHFFAIFGNAAAAVANMFNMHDGVKKFGDAFGKFGTKIFLILNGAINSLEYINKKNLLGAIGHFIDVIIGFTSKHDTAYLNRGNSVGTYTYANTLSTMNGKGKFDTFAEHFEHLKEGVKKSYQNVFSRDFFKNFIDEKKGMAGILSGIFCNLGSGFWHLMGQEQIATAIRDFGGIMVDLEQAHPGHLKAGKKFYFASGIGLMGGTVCDFLAKMLPYYKKTLVPVSLAIDSFGRYLLRISHNKGELDSDSLEEQKSANHVEKVHMPIPILEPEDSYLDMAS